MHLISCTNSRDSNLAKNTIKEWTIRDAIPGEPDQDYPIFSNIPDTDFSCTGRIEGYYADVEARCLNTKFNRKI